MNRRHTTSLLLAAVLASLASAAAAQYKIVEPGGRVTYTDRPSPSASAKVEPLRATGGAAATNANLPFELRQIVERYPITLYTGDGCDPCAAGRSLLSQRGVPFTEKTVRSNADRAAFQSAENSNELPTLRIGNQQLRGYTEAEWRSYLDAAGYPTQSKLPASYRQADATPLAPEKPAAKTEASAGPSATAPRPAALPPALETAPNGIRF